MPPRARSPSLPTASLSSPPNEVSKTVTTSPSTLDIDFLYNLLNECIDLKSLATNLTRQNHHYYHHVHHHNHNHHSHHAVPNSHGSGSESPHRIMPKECIVEKFIEILLHVKIDSFGNAFKLFKLICHFQKCFNAKVRSKKMPVSFLFRA